ncbi:Uncharacterised protein [Leclercia adecarboxylata]|uniref:Uncharacterized protein n=1 Tax=Leclercia adecarboxylata TaxID=83655 RepID=A0A4U9HZ65_9ENTR|nr:Uncharacterised protein [Leclercia adecarboxylata]
MNATVTPSVSLTLWFGGNLQITAIVTGALAVVLGGDVVCLLLACWWVRYSARW